MRPTSRFFFPVTHSKYVPNTANDTTHRAAIAARAKAMKSVSEPVYACGGTMESTYQPPASSGR